eukprot:3494391-Lingulodinium_polyedra.AAC.1
MCSRRWHQSPGLRNWCPARPRAPPADVSLRMVGALPRTLLTNTALGSPRWGLGSAAGAGSSDG